MLKPLSQRSTARTLALGIVSGVALALVAAAASAEPIISGLYRTGTEYPVGTGGQDTHWEVFAFPTAYKGNLIPGEGAWVFSGLGSQPGGGGVKNVPPPWYPGASAGGGKNPGVEGARWIGLKNNDATSLFPGIIPVTDPLNSNYSVIYRTTFQSDRAGLATFSLNVAADNAISFFVGGSVNNSNTYLPTMTGQQIGSQKTGLASLGWVDGNAMVVAGTNYLYAVVTDNFTVSPTDPTIGNYGYTGFIVVAVPEPSSFVLAALGGGVMAIGVVRRRLKRLA